MLGPSEKKRKTTRETNNRHKSLNCQQLLKRVIMSNSTFRVERQAPVAKQFFLDFFRVVFGTQRENFQLPKNAHLSGVYLLQHFFVKVNLNSNVVCAVFKLGFYWCH